MVNNEVIASYCLCNSTSLNIYNIENGIEESVKAGINNFKSRKYKLYYTGKGAYFNFGGSRFYLNDFVSF